MATTASEQPGVMREVRTRLLERGCAPAGRAGRGAARCLASVPAPDRSLNMPAGDPSCPIKAFLPFASGTGWGRRPCDGPFTPRAVVGAGGGRGCCVVGYGGLWLTVVA